jgi:hypothetical protein
MGRRDPYVSYIECLDASVDRGPIYCNMRIEKSVYIGPAGCRPQLARTSKTNVSGRYQPCTWNAFQFLRLPALVISNDDDVRKNTKLPVIQDGSDRASRISVVYKHRSDPSCCHNFLVLGQAAAPPNSLVPDREPSLEACPSMSPGQCVMTTRHSGDGTPRL